MSVNNQSSSDEFVNQLELGKKLRESREYLDLSQEEVATEVGIGRAAISLIESGQRRVTALELKKFARIYKRPTSYFTDEESAEGLETKEIEHLARAVAQLSNKDRDEVARFAEFLSMRSQSEEK